MGTGNEKKNEEEEKINRKERNCLEMKLRMRGSPKVNMATKEK